MSRPNVFLVTADGLRYDRLSHSGNEAPTSPTLDTVAEQGAVCRNAIATGTGTRTSFPGILTSSYPLMYGGYAQLTEHRVPISSVFQDRGYVTLGVNTNAQLHTRFGWDRGYDVYYDSEQVTVNESVGSFGSNDSDGTATGSDESLLEERLESLKSTIYKRLDHEGLAYRALESAYRRVEGRDPPHDRAEEAVDRLFSFLDRVPEEEPLFVWIHFMETHSPYVPPRKYREQLLTTDVSGGRLWEMNDRLHTEPETLTDEEVTIISELYNASLRYLDDQIGRLFDGLRDREMLNDSVVAFTADHGEQSREHGEMTHCSEPWEEGAHVPLLFQVSDDDLADVERVTSTIDIGPTLLDAAFGDPDVPDKFHGHSLLPVLRGAGSLPDDRAVFSQSAAKTGREIYLDHRLTGVRTDRWKFITSVNNDVETKLYDLEADPGEQANIADEHPDLISEFQQRVDDHYELAAYTDYEIKEAVDTGDVSERLQALGYLDH